MYRTPHLTRSIPRLKRKPTTAVWRRRYGLIGPNGSGKSSLLKALGNRELPIPDHIDVYFLDREIDATDLTALEAVMSVDEEKARLEAEAEALADVTDNPDAEMRLEDIYERSVCSTLSPLK